MDEKQQAAAKAGVFLRPIASPLALGFLALAAGTFAMAGLELSWISPAQSPGVGLAVLGFTVPLQLVSFVYGFLARDSAAATGMGLQAGGWLAIGLVTYTSPPGHHSGGLGLILLGAGAALLVPALTAAQTKLLAATVMTLTSVRFFLTAGYELSAAPGWKTAAGIAGLVLTAVALYAGLAFELEDSRKSTLLPTLRRGPARRALTGDLSGQAAGAVRDAGVRQRL
jgi:succinate-acetate transporter protein